MSKKYNYDKDVQKAFAQAVSSISQTIRQPEEFVVALLNMQECEFETFRIFKIYEATDKVGEHGIAWTRWVATELTDIVWTFDDNTDVLWSNNNQSALFFTGWEERYSKSKKTGGNCY